MAQIQLTNESNSRSYTFNWSDGTQSILAASSVCDISENITDAEVDAKIANFDGVLKVGGDVISAEDFNVNFDATEGNDIKFTISPATVNSTSAIAHTREVIIKLTNTAGERHAWFNGYVTLTIADDATAGTATIVDDNDDLVITNTSNKLFLRKGYGKVTINCAGTWANGETNTITCVAGTVRNVVVSDATSVETSVIS